MYIVSIIFGLIIVISSIFMIRFELNRVILKREQLLEQSKVYKEEDLFALLESLQTSIDEMNGAFYEIASDLEGKYSQHEKEIQLLEEKVLALSTIPKSGEVLKVGSKNETETIIHAVKSHAEKMDQLRQEVIVETKEITDPPLMMDEQAMTLREKVIKRRSEGVPLKAIAKEFDMGIGELQLLIQLPDVTKKT